MPTLCFTYHTVVSLQIQRTPFCLLDTFIYVAPLESDKMMMMMIKNVKVPSHTVDQSTVCQRLHCSSSYHTVVSWRMENNVLRLLFTSLELELEIVHNKKNIYYKIIDGKEAQSLYISPVIAKMKIKFFLIPANDLLAITSLLRLFYSFTTLLL